ncbi:hypothetical protein NPX13_g5409 [Xylaria arbuscula]|uniref:Uncharacterized protein n=1 Tax=Xylaria arbuscula TaxID=114810 RepID=A0A9W8NDQ1_9PEZI|nr:hypothetical protein NPX13_g5409 [Xylaria arbuscula]
MSRLPALSRELSLTYDDAASPPPVHPPVLPYTRDNWFLVPRNESGVLVPLSQRSTRSNDKLYLEYRLDVYQSDNAEVEFDLDMLLSRDTRMDFRTETSLASADSTDDGGMAFRFDRTTQWLHNPDNMKRVLDMDRYLGIDATPPDRITKKRVDRRPPLGPDMVKTVFSN